MQDTYNEFAEIYDRLMADVPYEAWVSRIRELLLECGIRDGLVAELGCGTGLVTRRLAALGYDMIGIDSSEEMLEIARDRETGEEMPRDRETGEEMPGVEAAGEAGTASQGILYLDQDMRSFELYGTVRGILSVCDSINYLTDPADIEKVFALANNYLDPGGILILDFHTPVYYRETVGERTISDISEDIALVWENEEEEDGVHASYLTIFRRQENGSYSRFDEVHLQRGYTCEEMRRAAEKAGLRDIRFYEDYGKAPATDQCDRILMTAREHGKSRD